jgi:hypothetical protein
MNNNGLFRQLQENVSRRAKKGYPILLAGALFFILVTIMPYIVSSDMLPYVWILGMGSIFPLGLLLARILQAEIIITDNPLATLGGLAGGVQVFYIPVFIIIAKLDPNWLPAAVGLLGGSHFLIYMWVYRSKAYLFITIATGVSSLFLSIFFLEMSYQLVAPAIAVVYGIGIVMIWSELKQEVHTDTQQMM